MSNEETPATSPTPNLPVQFYLMRHKYANDDKQDRLVMRFSDGKMVIVQNHGTKTAASHYDDEQHLNERWGVQSGNWGFYEYMLLESGAVNAMQEKIANLGQYKHNAQETILQYIADASTMGNELKDAKQALEDRIEQFRSMEEDLAKADKNLVVKNGIIDKIIELFIGAGAEVDTHGVLYLYDDVAQLTRVFQSVINAQLRPARDEIEALKEKLRIVENENKNVEGEYKLANEKWREAKETIKNKDLLISALYESLKEAGVSEDVLKQYFTYGRMENLPEIVNQLAAPYKKRAEEAESNVHAAIDKSNDVIAQLNRRFDDAQEVFKRDLKEANRNADAFNETNKSLASRLAVAMRGLRSFGIPSDKVKDIVWSEDGDRMSNYVGNHIASGELVPEGTSSKWEKKVRKLRAKLRNERIKYAALMAELEQQKVKYTNVKADLDWMKSIPAPSVFPPDYRLPITDPALEDVIEHFKSMPPGTAMFLPTPEDPAATILRLLENKKIRLGRDGRLRVIPD